MDSSSTVVLSLPWYRRLNQNKGLLLALVSMAQMLDLINVASVTITLPDIMIEVGFKVDQLQWVSSAYALAYGAFLLVGGRFGDLFGHRRIFIAGVTWFAIWSLVNGFAHNPVIMSVGRALQGMGAGFTVPSALAILTTTYAAGPERTRALAIFGGTGAVGSIVGVLLGGIFGSTIGWRWIFYITSIVAFLMGILGVLVIPLEKADSNASDLRIDYFGILTFMFGVVTIIYYLSEGPSSGWKVASTLAPLLVGIVMLMVFVVIENKIDYPIMPLRIWRSRRLVASCVCIASVSASMNGMIYFSSLVLQNVLGYTPLHTSFAYIVNGVGSIIAIVVLTKILPMVRTKILMTVGWFFLIGSGMLWAQIKVDSSYWSIPFPSLILNFLGLAPVWLCCQVNSVADADDEDQGVVGAVFNVSLQIGGPIGIAITNIIANTRNSPTDFGAALLSGYRAAFYAVGIIAAVGLVLTVILASNRDPPNMHTKSDAPKISVDAEIGGEPSIEMDTAYPSEVSDSRSESTRKLS
ncbi:hypothetical protein BGZ80_011346 [Entomortierella chlamydospora]|uniref:Major facilitator superfamily (MFS) profile domain-containing protein n=1 Tax=Entomortierella chlamydospora TaxID=101097 RepID=A0A9P6N3X7_9FUNG|nr:hypothetical protein BGZ79_007823 [Entomortierella chlamydospora]KAG0022740.1 hypothetical protein BGZ80_011346 [Entomortierella chlamydospora]